MDILKSAIDWAKGEVFSTSFFIIFGVVFMFASVGFWYLGKTEIARAYIIPTLVTGAMLLIIGFGLFFNNVARIKQFEKAYKADATAFVESELERAEATLKEYKNVVFTAIPIIIAVLALVLLFANTPAPKGRSSPLAIGIVHCENKSHNNAEKKDHAGKDPARLYCRPFGAI